MLEVPQAESPPVIDGRPNEAVWERAARADRFWISEQQRPPTEPTEAWVMADRTHLYVAFRVIDAQPQGIAALQTRRDAGLGFDDQVAVQLDPFLSYREVSTYSVNAIGTQDDAVAGGRARQLVWKGDWKAAVSRSAEGWTAEIAIPFEILNFDASRGTMGVNFLRYHHRTREWSRWADVTVRNLPEQMGRLQLQPGPATRDRAWTFLPYVMVGRQVPDRQGIVQRDVATTGIDIRYEPRPHLTGMLSLRPDFSQIESALTNINFNYNERFRSDPRPFFQEGAAYFGRDHAYFYSNRIPNFDVGGKFFARQADWQVGALATRAPDGRSDAVVDVERQFERTHRAGVLMVSTDEANRRSALAVMRGQGRLPSGLDYALDAAFTRDTALTDDGHFLRGKLGWSQGLWTVGGQVDGYSRHYQPRNGLLAADLPDTTGGKAFAQAAREEATGPLRQWEATVSWDQRRTANGQTQREGLYLGGAVELRQEVKLGLSGFQGQYRPLRGSPGRWADTLNDDRYATISVDFNTRSSHLGYGLAHAQGRLGGDRYRYDIVYLWARPTPTTFVRADAEQLESFGRTSQAVLSAGWDFTPTHNLVARVVYTGQGTDRRGGWTWRARRGLDIFAVVDRPSSGPTAVSVKGVMTWP